MSEQRLVDLETRLAFQEDHIQELNLSVALQQQLLETLVSEVRDLRRQLRALDRGQPADGVDGPPPHY